MTELLRRAWDTLDTFKQAYPENWHEEDEQVLKDLLQADLKLSGVKLKWVGLTHEELCKIIGVGTGDSDWNVTKVYDWLQKIETALKEKNFGV